MRDVQPPLHAAAVLTSTPAASPAPAVEVQLADAVLRPSRCGDRRRRPRLVQPHHHQVVH